MKNTRNKKKKLGEYYDEQKNIICKGGETSWDMGKEAESWKRKIGEYKECGGEATRNRYVHKEVITSLMKNNPKIFVKFVHMVSRLTKLSPNFVTVIEKQLNKLPSPKPVAKGGYRKSKRKSLLKKRNTLKKRKRTMRRKNKN